MFPKIYINKFIFSDKVQFGFSEATASSSHLQILPLLCVIGESPSLKMYGHKLWQSPAIGSSWRAKFGSLDQTGSKTILHIIGFGFVSIYVYKHSSWKFLRCAIRCKCGKYEGNWITVSETPGKPGMCMYAAIICD